MSKCGLDECDLFGGCVYDCQHARAFRKEASEMDKALIEDAKKLDALVREGDDDYRFSCDKD